MSKPNKLNPVVCLPYKEGVVSDDIYLKHDLKNISLSLKRVFGVVNSEAKRLTNEESKKALIDSLIQNFLLFSGIYNLPKEQFLKVVEFWYIDANTAKKAHTTKEGEIYLAEDLIPTEMVK